MAPLSRKASTKRALPTSPTSQAPFPNDSNRQKAEVEDNNMITFVTQPHPNQQRSFPDYHVDTDPHQVDLLDDADFCFAAANIEDHAAENTRKMIDVITSLQLRRQHQTYNDRLERKHAIAQSDATACAAAMGHGMRQQSTTNQTGGKSFVLTAEDSKFVSEFFKRVTPIGESPLDIQSIAGLMESGNDEEDAKQFLDQLESNMKQGRPPKSQSLTRLRQNPFIRDISRMKGPIYNYCEDIYRLG